MLGGENRKRTPLKNEHERWKFGVLSGVDKSGRFDVRCSRCGKRGLSCGEDLCAGGGRGDHSSRSLLVFDSLTSKPANPYLK